MGVRCETAAAFVNVSVWIGADVRFVGGADKCIVRRGALPLCNKVRQCRPHPLGPGQSFQRAREEGPPASPSPPFGTRGQAKEDRCPNWTQGWIWKNLRQRGSSRRSPALLASRGRVLQTDRRLQPVRAAGGVRMRRSAGGGCPCFGTARGCGRSASAQGGK